MIFLEPALDYAARGWHVFPLRPGTSVPATVDGFQSATTNPDAIVDWWTANPDYNIGIATGVSGLFVIDVDGPDDLLSDSRKDVDFDATLHQAMAVKTPRGGTHYYLSGEGRSSVGTFADKVDTRGVGGYVVAAPSVRPDGVYAVTQDVKDLPTIPWQSAPFQKFGRHVARVRENGPDTSDWNRDNPQALKIAEQWLKGLVQRGKVAISGHGGDSTTYLTACSMLEFGLSTETATKLLVMHWNPHCQPPWDIADLRLKVENAASYGQDTSAAKANVVDASSWPDMPENVARRRYYPVILHEARAGLKDIEWLVPGVFPKQGVAFIYGPSGTYKTFLALDLAMSVATGLGANWWPDESRDAAPVLYVIGEGQHALKRRRVDAWYTQHPVPGLEYATQLYLVDQVPPLTEPAIWSEMLDALKDQCGKPALIVVDTLSRAMLGLDENSAQDAGTASIRLENFSKAMNCLVLVIHHSGKDSTRGLRGSGAWQANSDVVIQMEQVYDGLPIVDLWVRKQKDGEAPERPMRFEGKHSMKSLTFHREFDTNFTVMADPEIEYPWQTATTLHDALLSGSMTTEHLVSTISHHFGTEEKLVRRWLNVVKDGRFARWFPDGLLWRIPDEVLALGDNK